MRCARLSQSINRDFKEYSEIKEFKERFLNSFFFEKAKNWKFSAFRFQFSVLFAIFAQLLSEMFKN